MPLQLFDTNAYLILYLFLIKYIFYRRFKSGKMKSTLQQHSLTIYRGMLVSWLLLFLYLIIIRLILGWELRWLSPVYILYFFTSILLDAYYFGLKNEMPQYSIFNNTILQKIEQLPKKFEIAEWFRMTKKFYYLISFILYAISAYAYFLLVPIPTVDSFRYFKKLSGICNENNGLVKNDSYYYYPVSLNERDYGNFSIKENVVANKLIFSEDADGGLGLYEMKAFFFRKHIITIDEREEMCFYVDSLPITLDKNEILGDSREQAIARQNRIRYLDSKRKINFNILKKHGYFIYDDENGVQHTVKNYEIEGLAKLYDPTVIDQTSCIKINITSRSIEICARCVNTGYDSIGNNAAQKSYENTHLLYTLKK